MKIEVAHGKQQKLAKELGYNKNTIRGALTFSTTGDNPEHIRRTAMKYHGGILIGGSKEERINFLRKCGLIIENVKPV
jgi:hypothetical protein